MWTPALGYSSPPSPVSSQLSWDQDEEEDFQSQMDENGIIGHREMEKEGEVALEAEGDLFLDAGTPEPEEGPPSALEDLNCHLSELLDSEPLSQPTGDNCFSLSHNSSEHSVSLEDWSDDGQNLDEEGPDQFNSHRPTAKTLEDVKINDATEVKTKNLQQKMDPKYIWLESRNAACNKTTEQDLSRMSETQRRAHSQSGADEISYVISTSPRSDRPAQVLSSLTRDIESEIFSESRAESDTSRLSHSHRTFHPGANTTPLLPSPLKINSLYQETHQVFSSVKVQSKDRTSPTSAAPLSTYQHRRLYSHGLSKTSHTDLNDVRKGQLSHALPDFSKIEPRVRFPKSSYKPPKSRRPRSERNSQAKAPVVFKSPADIVREVLLSSTEGLSDTAACAETQKPLNTTVPEELRCPLQATNLVQQLQDDYNKLLTKYAEAENTIDRLRLEAKVHLHSDPPKPSQPLLSGVMNDGRKVLTLSFPQAQRAELSTDAVQSTHEMLTSTTRGTPTHPIVESVNSFRGPESLTATQQAEAVFQQMQGFQLKVDEFEKLLKSERLDPYEQIQRFSQLVQRQESIERAYLTAREKHRQLQKQTGGTSDQFDPDRDLEGLIFQSGMRLEELKESMEQTTQDQTSLEPTASLPSPDHQLCVTLNEMEPKPKSPISVPHPEVMFGLEVTSLSEESNSNREEHEEIFLPFFSSLNHKHQRMETDLSHLMNESQNLREFSRIPDKGTAEEDRSSYPARYDQINNEQRWRTEDERDSNHPVQPLPMADSMSGHSCSSLVSNSMETFPEIPLPDSLFRLPGQHDSGKRATSGRKSHNMLGESAATEKRDSKESAGVLKAPLQDGVISPETDSGFMGSESSRQTPAAHSPVQQRTAVRVTRPSVTPNKCKINPETVAFSGQGNTTFPSHTQPSSDRPRDRANASGDTPGSLGRKGKGKAERRHSHSTFTSSSSHHWPSRPLQPSPIGHISELQSDRVPSLSEDEPRQGRSLNTKNPTLTVPHHHSEHRKTQTRVQLTNQHEAFQSLHEEVDRLKEHLEESLRTTSPLKRASHHASTPQRNFRSLERKTDSKRSENEEKKRQNSMPRRRSTSVPRLRPQLDITTDSEQSEPITPSHSSNRPIMTHTFQRGRTSPRTSTRPRPSRHIRSRSSDRSEERNNEDRNRRPIQMCPNCSMH
ncbi:microtubule organization protein AKNA isoform X2 [Trichomycterus rosablanca]|uniref:microtubule organization protein AKNA isoform X2 n=1 Tax=Trichomycterus rosablanca TaxID=2290929 RepID=UPI002F35E604